MNHARLVALIQDHQEALLGAPDRASQEVQTTILGILRTLDRGEITVGQALRFLGQLALLAMDDPPQARRYRQAAAAIRQLRT